MQLAPFARQLDRCFDGFRAAVEQVSLIATGAMAQALSEVELSAVVQAVAGVDQRLGLVSQRLDQHLGAVAEAVGCVALTEIQVGTVVAVPQPRALAAHEHVRRAGDAGHQGLAGRRLAGRLEKQIVQARRSATEQIHSSPPIATGPWSVRHARTALRFFALPM